jgi:uncharacterized protein YbjT (DUF2867 family)
MYAVTCASGRTGSVVARVLLEAGRKVRVVVRDAARGVPWRERGAEVAVADYRDTPALTQALRGAEAAYVIPPPLPVTATGHHQYRVLATEGIARALEAAGVPFAVSLSSFAAQHAEGTGMIKSCHACERVLSQVLRTSITHLRPTFFLENWIAQIPAVREGVLPSFLGPAERRFTMVGTVDIGVVAARLMLEPAAGHRVVELTGPEDYSVADVAAAFGRLLGRNVTPQIHPVSAISGFLEKSGFSAETAANYQELFAGMMTGHVALEGNVPLQRGTYGLAYTLATMLGRAAA